MLDIYVPASCTTDVKENAVAVWSVYETGPGSSCGIRILGTLISVTGESSVSVVESAEFGTLLSVGDAVLYADRDEDPYHEMLALLPLVCAPKVTSVLLAGGSDAVTLEMLVRMPQIERITMVGVDTQIVDAVKRCFPRQARAFADPRVHIEPREASAYVRESRDRFDLIIVDAPGAAVSPQYPPSFFCDSFRLLTSDGAVVLDCGTYAHSGSRRELISAISKLKRLFPVFRLYEAPGVLPIFARHLFAIATKTFDPSTAEVQKQVLKNCGELHYLNAEMLRSCFSLPESVRKLVESL